MFNPKFVQNNIIRCFKLCQVLLRNSGILMLTEVMRDSKHVKGTQASPVEFKTFIKPPDSTVSA